MRKYWEGLISVELGSGLNLKKKQFLCVCVLAETQKTELLFFL